MNTYTVNKNLGIHSETEDRDNTVKLLGGRSKPRANSEALIASELVPLLPVLGSSFNTTMKPNRALLVSKYIPGANCGYRANTPAKMH